ILIGSLDWANAGDAAAPASATSAVVAFRKYPNLRLALAIDVSPFSIRLVDGLPEVQHRPCRKSNETALDLRRKALRALQK
ncbi:MAG TPA: hypothetical protein VGD75_01965, partial [Bradyrhizobium sp.]